MGRSFLLTILEWLLYLYNCLWDHLQTTQVLVEKKQWLISQYQINNTASYQEFRLYHLWPCAVAVQQQQQYCDFFMETWLKGDKMALMARKSLTLLLTRDSSTLPELRV